MKSFIKNSYIVCSVVFLGVVSILISCGSDFKTHANEKDGYTVKYPAKWELEDAKQDPGISAIFKSSAEGEASLRLVVTSGDVPPNFDSEKFKNFALETMKNFFENFKVYNDKEQKIGGKKGFVVVYDGTVGDVVVTNKQAFVVDNNVGYSVVLSAYSDVFKKYDKIADKVIDSFKITRK